MTNPSTINPDGLKVLAATICRASIYQRIDEAWDVD